MARAWNNYTFFIDDMFTYICYIKSHIDFPDYEQSVKANSRKEAIEIFYKQLGEEFDKDFIDTNMMKV